MGATSLDPHASACSRRRLIAIGAAAWAAGAPPLFAQEAAQPAQREPLPARDSGPRLSIPVRIGGQGPYQFIVDTGAELSVIATEVASALGLPTRERVLLHGMARSVPSDTVEAPGLEIGRIHVRRAQLPVLPRAWIGADGYLGIDVLNGHRVDFDFRKKTLTLGAPMSRFATVYHRPDEAVVRADGLRGKLRAVDCTVGGVSASAFVDTGADASVGNTALLKLLARRRPVAAGQETVRLTGVTGGYVDCQRVRSGRLTMAGMEIEDVELAISDLKIFELWGLARSPALFIGMDLLRQFNEVAIDYGRNEYRFDVGEAGPWLLRRA